MQKGWDCPLYILRGHRLEFLKDDVFMSLEIVLMAAKSVDPDEMPHFSVFQLGLHSLSKYQIRDLSIQSLERVNNKCCGEGIQ